MFRHSPLWDSSRTRKSNITATSGESMGWSGSKREDELVWKIGIEKLTLSRKPHKNTPKNWRIAMNLLRKDKSSHTIENWWIVYATWEGSCYCDTIITQIRDFQNKVNSLSMKKNSTILSQRAALQHLTFLLNLGQLRVPEAYIASVLDCRPIDGILRVRQETFFKPICSRRITSSRIRGTWHLVLADWNLKLQKLPWLRSKDWYESHTTHKHPYEASKEELESLTKLVELVRTVVWSVIRVLHLGNASWVIPRLHVSPKLVS